ncbi:MAG: MFS transporter [Armatimonadetes bacterium]|nr:MFS transporter [Armatimonadota bacterium]
MTTTNTVSPDLPDLPRTPVLQLPEFRRFLMSIGASTLAGSALAVVLGYQIYSVTGSPLALGYLGLVEAIPALSLALFGGHVADRADRRQILLVTQSVSIFCALLFAYLSSGANPPVVNALYGVVFILGIARGFGGPAFSAFEGQIVPRAQLIDASGYLSATWQTFSILGPALGGLCYDQFGAKVTYFVIAGLWATALFLLTTISPKPVVPEPGEAEGKPTESIWQSIAVGLRFVFSTPALVGSMALDLFAVLFGGAIALLPVFAKDILHVGAGGLGLLNAAPSIGALSATLIATRYPPLKHAGRNLLIAVAAFGVSIIVFALSKNLYLTLLALFFSGITDGISMVIRRAILRLLSPNAMRGRISAVSMIFIGSSNEIGAFESGIAANALGTVRSVWVGGIVTLLIVAGTATFAPQLRNLRFDTGTKPDEK